jgi:LmbE family N-acetylglucosaminyl deacetylase
MKQEEFEFVRLVGNERRVGARLADVSRHWQGNQERFLFVSPHDDDAVLGAGLLIQLAKLEKVPVHILIVTDGSMGYCSDEEKDAIARIRHDESLECYQALGLPKENITWLGYPDCRLNSFRGRTPTDSDAAPAVAGFVGMQNSFTHSLRQIRPTQCFVPTSNDLHPDHRFVYDEFMISLFHASGNIWPELGEPLAKVPYVSTYAVYCDFNAPPTLRMRTPASYLESKLKAIGAFRSQRQISALIENVRHCGPEEYIRAIDFKLYHPADYHNLFEERRPYRIME